ncbi:MAG: hypothetical protein LUH23_07265 [Oscillospiraceae bacterium]|nr:hypothetical protein [Oscillospiraceae bacterium]
MSVQKDVKIAYIILCHDDPAIVSRIAHALEYGEDRVFAHVDKKSDFTPFRDLLYDNRNVVIANKRIETFWGYSSIVATMETIRQAFEYDKIMIELFCCKEKITHWFLRDISMTFLNLTVTKSSVEQKI